MTLPENVYKLLEEVVGPEYISDKEYILAANRNTAFNSAVKPYSPDAILLPKNTQEVQAIVKICNQHNVKYIPNLSSLSGQSFPNDKGTIILHLKRMNRILEINEQDRYTVVEPGVRHAQLKPELMKRGLSYPVAAVGPGGSVLANFTSTSGDHHDQHGTSRGNRYLLGVEWVTPTGEVVRTGSLGTDSGWFCPDGPGPSLRGLIKGYGGNYGWLGIMTKAAIGLDAWKGPKIMPSEGHSPSIKIRLPKECHKVFIFKFPTLDQLRDAMIEIGKAEIGFAVLKYFNATAALMLSESANDFWQLWNSGLFQKELARPLYVYLATWSPEEMAYEEKVLNEIIQETGGEPVDESIRKMYEDNMDFFMIVSFLQRVLRLGLGWMPTKLSADSVTHMFDIAKAIPEFINDFIEQGKILNAPDNFQIVPMEYGHMAHIELLFLWDTTSPATAKMPFEFIQKSGGTDMRHGFHSTMPRNNKAALEMQGPLYSNYHIWAAQIKEAFDPNKVSNPVP
jgi:glycolate oxidase